jgi:hypothetical protein
MPATKLIRAFALVAAFAFATVSASDALAYCPGEGDKPSEPTTFCPGEGDGPTEPTTFCPGEGDKPTEPTT